jgi:hypothetical protein
MPTPIGTFGVCLTAQADTKANPKRADFADPLLITFHQTNSCNLKIASYIWTLFVKNIYIYAKFRQYRNSNQKS